MSVSSSHGYLPRTEALQVVWATDLAALVNKSAAAYGVPTATAASFEATVALLNDSYAAANNPATRTKAVIRRKDDALRAMRLAARNVVSLIQGTETVTPEMKLLAGLTVRDNKPTPAPIPPGSPFVEVLSVDGRNVTLGLRQSKAKRGKPAKVASATIFVATGPSGSTERGEFAFATTTGKTTVTIPFPPSETGDTAYITAFWTNTAQVSGPASSPITVNLPAGAALPTPVATKETTAAKSRVRLAA